MTARRRNRSRASSRVPLLWSSDGWLYLRAPGQFPVRVYRRNLTTGHIELWRDIALADPAGVVLIRQVLLAEDGNLCVFNIFAA